ncbi:MAG TPA: glycine--tRNA ligase [Sediminibacterium sp.]|uniref:glycine--tRNA ligase n=1 Tax=Sediminibacterium sp. TaxID=1917865 RepID=UPI0008CD1EDE|nr:glycine--tRNA ligase [Sediminibacterium sp.]OHC86855.1 MAG: glycine--tRNA ligase [Sphingobacteriia bacterium RIFOXYC2_FULL_35_18]OHC88289.1 MAG: glycine--tRNA ligase [Sphingobacteriia bacterium RIFOXYD2_FULL_35_12]HLD51769.1 glycine--tRNA ligase [Sediminibacterium sp.]
MSTATENTFQAIISHAKEYGFVFQSSEIYDGLSAVYDYGPYGSELKKNIKDYWWKSMTQMHQNIVGIDAAIFMHPTTWKASGHVDNFSDPMIDNKDSQKRYRVDHLIEAKADQLTEAGKATEANALIASMEQLLAAEDFVGLKQLLADHQIVCSVSGTGNWTEIRQFNLMFSTQLGSVAEDSDTIYLRPETAQGIFVNFLNVQKTARMKIPFGIAQTGKAFRNEIVARQFIFRMREFEQMEMQFFVRPGTQMEWYNYWKEERLNWHLSLGLPAAKYRYHDHVKLAHYADAALDIEYEFPFGFKEVEGIHSRTDFDLKSHQEYSKKKQQYFDNDLDEATGKPFGNYIPYVVETSIGLDRMFLLILSHAYTEEIINKEDGTTDSRVVLKIPAKIAPNKLAILPLVKKDGLPEIARELMDECKGSFKCFYEEKDAIGKRYRRQDAIGTPFCVTIDHQTKEDQMVTIRYRDSMLQERIPINKVKELVLSHIN